MPGRAEFVALFALLTALTALGTDAILPALPAIADTFGSAEKQAMLTVTLFVFGMVFGEMVFGPLSDAIGRKPVILAGLALFAAGAVVAMAAPSLEVLVAGRILQGLGAAGSKIGSRAAIRDRFAGPAMAQAMSLIMTVFMFVPMIAPALGQGLMQAFGWHAIFAAYVAIAAWAGGWLALRQPETIAPEARLPLNWRPVIRNAGRIVAHRHVLAHTIAAGLIFGAHLHYLAVAQSLIGEVYGYGLGFPLIFALFGVGLAAAFFTNARLVMRLGMARLVNAALWGLAAVSLALILAALATEGVPPRAVFLPGMLATFFCVGILYGNLNAMAMQVLGAVAGLGTSVISSVSSLIAVIVALLAGWVYDLTLTPVAATFLAAAALSLAARRALQDTALIPVSPVRY